MNGNNLLANLPLRLPVPEGPYMQATPEPLPPRDTGGMPPWLSGAHQFAMQQFLKVLADRERNKGRVPSWQMPYPMPATQSERDVLGMLPVAGDVEDVRYLAEGVREGDPAKMLMGGAATALPFVPASLLHTVYHGSPHIFDAFKLDKIGTGEGAQAYGHGLYFAESPGVAHSYRMELAGEQPGAFYTVEIPDEAVGRMLDWDKPLSEQSESVREALKTAGVNETFPFVPFLEPDGKWNIHTPQGNAYIPGFGDKTEEDALQAAKDMASGYWKTAPPGQGVMDGLAAIIAQERGISPREAAPLASERLRQAGIPGIRYFDAMSRGKGEGSRNLVLFDESLAKILERK